MFAGKRINKGPKLVRTVGLEPQNILPYGYSFFTYQHTI